MKSVWKRTLAISLVLFVPVCMFAQSSKYKCLVQMDGYQGDGAYIVVSLIDAKGAYEKTLYVMGSDKKWYKSLKQWYAYYNQKKPNISAVTGASVTGGDRSVKVFEIEDAKINAGYKIRFESAVEDQKYHEKDVEVPLTTQALTGKTDGTGYIKFVRFSKVQ
ncbi:MAG: DUF2271 domain-containing protein [Pseudopedobacter saltans]|uniref:DUF2271 domain-containing protein n=1 Tax=Pseudopedobacter saltans TaxID=151895 RepID=A0A2W5H0D6_9SPHI|nr:MAG: DUF2271 domain-containing protein [Pseudopedobacter saltans]